MVLIIFTQYHILNIHASIAAMRTMASYGSTAAEESAVTVAVSALSDYHTPEHKEPVT